MNDTTKPLICCLMGPTAAGKTALAIDLTQHFPCDIISVDSALVYRDMNIGTAKPTAEELALAPHRLIDICDPADAYSAADFCDDATREIQSIIEAGRIPLLVGGTMLYFQALQFGLSPLPKACPEVRAEIDEQARQQGWQALHQQLNDIDPQAASRIHANDPQRIQRALEVYRLTGRTLSEWHQQSAQQSPYRFFNFALMPSVREVLHQRIAKRFQLMLEQGLIEEVTQLRQRGDLHLNCPSIRAVGYRQVWQYLAGEYDYQQMQDKAVVATRQLAKRQLTWLRQWQDKLIIDECTQNASEILRESLQKQYNF